MCSEFVVNGDPQDIDSSVTVMPWDVKGGWLNFILLAMAIVSYICGMNVPCLLSVHVYVFLHVGMNVFICLRLAGAIEQPSP